VSVVTTMSVMFYDADAFNQDLSNWNLLPKCDTLRMFGARKDLDAAFKPTEA
jgi:hypothetical protein